MALSQSLKAQVFQICALAVPTMSGAEFLRATIAQASVWAAATDATVATTIISELNAFRAANPDGPGAYLATPAAATQNSSQTVGIAQTLAKLG